MPSTFWRMTMNGTIYFRADHELIGRVLAEKLRRKTERTDFADGLRIVGKDSVLRRAA